MPSTSSRTLTGLHIFTGIIAMPTKRVTRKSVGVGASGATHDIKDETVVEEIHVVERIVVNQSVEQENGDALESTQALEVSLNHPEDYAACYLQNGKIPGCDQAANSYLENCQKFGIQVDAGVVVALKTG
jgi:hypothetical protein